MGTLCCCNISFRSESHLMLLSTFFQSIHSNSTLQIVIDLCAAPGGWTQVASRSMSKESQVVIAVDILPIRAIGPNVITLIGDITTEKCKSSIRSEMQGAAADVVLCDGAPNIGASYDRDAYMQNEIALHALKCATEHLKRGGSFVTKIYRSQDYSSYLWVVKQLFRTVQAVKPNASRSQSAEIFLVCQEYLDPTKIDPRMLDPRHVFEQVDGAATGGGDAGAMAAAGTGKMNIFHKKYGEKTRSRQGYDMTLMDATMRTIGSIADFVEGKSGDDGAPTSTGAAALAKDPVAMLSVCTGLSFSCHLCNDKEQLKNDKEEENDRPSCNCKFYLNHYQTSPEIKACVADLKVLNKADFKGLLTWRLRMIDAVKAQNDAGDGSGDDGSAAASGDSDDGEVGSETEENQIQEEIQQLRQRKLREKKKLKKKERKLMAKKRQRAALGMDLNAIEVPDNEKIFSLATITSKGDLEAAREVDLAKIRDEDLLPTNDSDDDEGDAVVDPSNLEAQGEEDDLDEDTGYSYRLDRELDSAYDKYLEVTNNGLAKSGTKMAKRSKKLQRQKAEEEAKEDEEMMLTGTKGIDRDTKRYVQMLQQHGRDSDDSSDEDGDEHSDDDDDGFHSTPVTPKEHEARRKEKSKTREAADKNPLIYQLPSESASVKTARWFSNPVFENIGVSAQTSAADLPGASGAAEDFDSDESSDEEADGNRGTAHSSDSDSGRDDDSDDESERPSRKRQKREKITADDVLAMMPKTDKQKRHEKRLKAMEREERKKARRARLAGEVEGGFEVAPADDDAAAERLEGLDEQQIKKIKEARALIKAGMGGGAASSAQDDGGFEVVSSAETRRSSGPLPIKDGREYTSDNEDYDSDDYARTLALGTMMLRHSKAKAMVDASYNRYAWNDPGDLPDWFQDDENRHHRPQLPIPPELLAKMKEKFISLSTRPIAKVAEARARKNKRASTKLAAAKKKAAAVANSSEMSEAMKLKAISKAMRGQDASRPGKTYVISKKGGGTKGGKGIKLVDKRMKNDKRSMDRSTKKKKNGKKGGMTGSKKRRHHK